MEVLKIFILGKNSFHSVMAKDILAKHFKKRCHVLRNKESIGLVIGKFVLYFVLFTKFLDD